jgi:protein TonB
MVNARRAMVFAAALAAAGCAQPPAIRTEAGRATPRADSMTAATLDAYKKEMARRIAQSGADISGDPLPPMLKSIVVLDITIGRDGQPRRVEVRRSNGYKALEDKAMESVWRAAPYSPPGPGVLRGASAVSFLETFLFSDDDRFQIRSLVE